MTQWPWYGRRSGAGRRPHTGRNYPFCLCVFGCATAVSRGGTVQCVGVLGTQALQRWPSSRLLSRVTDRINRKQIMFSHSSQLTITQIWTHKRSQWSAFITDIANGVTASSFSGQWSHHMSCTTSPLCSSCVVYVKFLTQHPDRGDTDVRDKNILSSEHDRLETKASSVLSSLL